MKRALPLIHLFAIPLCCVAATVGSPTGNRTTPPTIAAVSPMGLARGTTVEMTVEGFNLAKASDVYFSDEGVKARILRIKELPDQTEVRLGSNGTASTVDLGPMPPRNQVTLEVEVAPDAPIGPVMFRVKTPLGTTPEGRFVVEPFYGESPDKEPNDTAEEAFESFLPSILVGTISRPGDVDFYKIHAAAGEQIVFSNSGPELGSALRPVISIFDENQKLVRAFTEEKARNSFAHQFDKAGSYYVRISDYEDGGSARHTYRIMVGKLPIVLSAFPLGVPQGKNTDVELRGFHLGPQKLTVDGKPSPDSPDSVMLRPKAGHGLAFNRVRLALGHEPELLATGKIQAIPIPVTINGRMTAPQQDFRFHARKGQSLILDVNASRLGSLLDSLIEVLDANAKPIERATVRCLLETSTSLRDHDSVSPGIRMTSMSGFAAGDLVMIGSEIIRIATMPPNPDADFLFESFGGERLTYFDTSSESHSLDSPVYKVQIAPPGAKFASNGLPVQHLTYRNDDGGPGYGKDSRLHFTAPADGEYLVRIRDVRGLTGDDYAYRLTVREPTPSYQLSVVPRNPNVPAGGRIPVTITAVRRDDFDGPIDVEIADLPKGLHATKGTILPGDVRTTLLLSADPDAQIDRAVPLVVRDSKGVLADPQDKLKLIAVTPRADIHMDAATKEIALAPGGHADVEVTLQRSNGFAGRVPVEVRNLPPGVQVTDQGLNGVLVNENEERRTFTVEVLSTATPRTQPFFAAGLIETRGAGQQNAFATGPIILKVLPPTGKGTN